MAGIRPSAGLEQTRPVLDLSGAKLRDSFERLVKGAELVGGVESFAAAVKLKSDVFRGRLDEGKAASLSRGEFDELVPLMATVRRRIGQLLDHTEWAVVRSAIVELLHTAHDTTIADNRIARFESAMLAGGRRLPTGELAAGRGGEERPAHRSNDRYLRDLASEILHNVLPEHYPLMNRWVWDARTNTGALREIWHDPRGGGDNVDNVIIDAPDGYETFLVLREELSQFLGDNGVFRDMLWHVDLLLAQVYGDYINAQGGAYLKTDFGNETDPLEHTRRIMGLDRVARERAARERTVDGSLAPAPLAGPTPLAAGSVNRSREGQAEE